MKRLMTMMAGIITAMAALAAGSRMTLSDIYYSDAYGSWVVEIGLDNPEETVNAFQCDIAIPKTFTFDVGTYVFTERALELRMGKYVDTHTCTSAVRANGCLRVLVYSSENKAIKGTDGTVLVMALKDASQYQNTPHDRKFRANMTNIALTRSVDGEIVEDAEYPEAVVGDSTLQCYNCMDNAAFVIGGITAGELEDINTNLSTNDRLVTVDLTRCTDASLGTLDVKNTNTIIMAAGEHQVDNTDNVFWKENGEWVCNSVLLSDNGLSLSLPFSARAKHFTYDRRYTGGVWNTVCLPVALTEGQYETLREKGVVMAQMSSFDAGNAVVSFAYADVPAANMPYIIKPKADDVVFGDLQDVVLVASERTGVAANGLTMQGNYDYTVICSTADTARYGYEEGTGEFVKLGQNCILKPFRCFLELPATTPVAQSRICISAGSTNGITDIAIGNSGDMTGNSGGKAGHKVYTIDGRRIKGRPAGGIYIIDGKKTVTGRCPSAAGE